jgi:hypothetical protein
MFSLYPLVDAKKSGIFRDDRQGHEEHVRIETEKRINPEFSVRIPW